MKRLPFGLLPALLIAASCALYATPPLWWTTGSTSIMAPGSPPNDFGPANVGQLKHVAKRAKAYLDANLSGGAGSTIDTMVAGFSTNLTTAQKAEQYAPINLGQLKNVAKPFYDRLIAVGYNTKQNLRNHGATGWAYDYPWNPSTPASENFAPANLGQLKLVFSFDLTDFNTSLNPNRDDDEDGLRDSWEMQYFGKLSYTADDDVDGDGLSNSEEYAASGDPANTPGEPPVYPPVAPSNVQRILNQDGTVTTTWQDNSENEDEFRVYERGSDGALTLEGIVPANQTSFTYTP